VEPSFVTPVTILSDRAQYHKQYHRNRISHITLVQAKGIWSEGGDDDDRTIHHSPPSQAHYSCARHARAGTVMMILDMPMTVPRGNSPGRTGERCVWAHKSANNTAIASATSHLCKLGGGGEEGPG
jgi:hypothetical protein